jgi:hypothetical protein
MSKNQRTQNIIDYQQTRKVNVPINSNQKEARVVRTLKDGGIK